MVSAGDSTSSRKTLTSLSRKLELDGISVIGGVNGDFYNLTTGVPIGAVVQDGRLISSNNTGWFGIGFKENGSVVIGTPDTVIKCNLLETEFEIARFNKAQSDIGVFLYNKDFGLTTGSTVPSLEIVISIISGQPAIGKTVIGTVSEVRSSTMATQIKENQMVLSVRNGKPGFDSMSKLKIGDAVGFEFNDPRGKWSDCTQVIGGEKILVQNGAITPGLATKDYNPVSAIGVKANGEIVLYQVDGRSEFSQGASSLEVAEFMRDLGCVQALKLDGGGSSAMIARTPGYTSANIISSPSDGSERANANGILLVSKRSEAIKNGIVQDISEPKKLYLHPYEVYALPKNTIQYTALATDEYYLPKNLPESMIWDTNAGEFDESGKLVINNTSGKYYIMAGSGFVLGTAQITVLDSVTSLKPSKSLVTILPGNSVDLSCEAFYQGNKVVCKDNNFTWKVEGNIGTITEEGIFTASDTASGRGRLVVSYGNVSSYIDVAITEASVIEDFEKGSLWDYSTVRSKSGNISVINGLGLAKSGSNLLKIDYDFSLDQGIEKGTAGFYGFRTDSNTKEQVGIALDNNPIAIGMWVYGDNSKAWLRAKLKDADGQLFDIDFTNNYRADNKTGGIDFIGWKYLEASIPLGKKGPFTLETPIRIMCANDDMRTKGTIYIDKIQALYVSEDEDITPPVSKIISPSHDSTVKTNVVPLNIQLSDQTWGSGIDISSMKVLLDGALMTDYKTSSNGVLTLIGELGTGNTLADGLHELVINLKDNAGNTATEKATFTVDTGAPQVISAINPTYYIGGDLATTFSVKNPKNLKKVYLSLKYDNKAFELVDADTKTSGKQIALESWVKKGKVINNTVDEENGRILIEVDNLANLSTASVSKLGTVTLKAKNNAIDGTQVKLDLGAMRVVNNNSSLRFSLPTMSAVIISEQKTALVPQNLSISLTPNNSEMTVNYLTKTDATGTLIQYIEKDNFDGVFTPSRTVIGSTNETTIVNLTKTEPMLIHTANLTGLKPGTEYVYRIGNDLGQFSTDYEFKTPNDNYPYSFAFVTDPQAADTASYKVFGDVLSRACEKANNLDFLLLGGDMADRGGNKNQLDMFFDSSSRIFSSVPIMVEPGNHEYYDDANLINYTSYFAMPENGADGLKKETSYSFETKDALFLVMDTQKDIKKQLEWLEAKCNSSDKKWKIVMMHRGLYSGFYDEVELRNIIAPVFDRLKIDLVLNGHDHTYLRTTMRDGKKVNIGAGTTYITGGSSAKKYYDAKARSWTTVLYDTNNPVFTTFKVYSNKIAVTSSHIENGKTIDHDYFEIVK